MWLTVGKCSIKIVEICHLPSMLPSNYFWTFRHPGFWAIGLSYAISVGVCDEWTTVLIANTVHLPVNEVLAKLLYLRMLSMLYLRLISSTFQTFQVLVDCLLLCNIGRNRRYVGVVPCRQYDTPSRHRGTKTSGVRTSRNVLWLWIMI